MTKEFLKARIKYLLEEGLERRIELALTRHLHSAFGLCELLVEGCEKGAVKSPKLREVFRIVQTHDWPKSKRDGRQMNGFWMNAWMNAYHQEHLYSASIPNALRIECLSAWNEWAKSTLKKIEAELLQD